MVAAVRDEVARAEEEEVAEERELRRRRAGLAREPLGPERAGAAGPEERRGEVGRRVDLEGDLVRERRGDGAAVLKNKTMKPLPRERVSA